MSKMGIINNSPVNVWRERGWEDEQAGKPNRRENARDLAGELAERAYLVGRRLAREQRERERAGG